MTDDSPNEAEVGPWAAEKLEALQRYLDYYTRVLKNQPWRTIYLDAFAGGGRARIRSTRKITSHQEDFLALEADPAPETVAFVEGSPRRSLDINYPFDAYIFIDADPKRIAMLKALQAEYGDKRRITIRNGSAASQIDWVLSKNPTRAKHRGVAFLDPFGAHLEWRSVQGLAETGVFEVLINLPLDMAINRLLKVDAKIPETWLEQLNAFFPEGWWDEAYIKDHGLLAGLLGDGEGIAKRPDARDRLLKFYAYHLQKAFGFVSKPKLIRNTRGHPLYYLIWAGPHRAGLKGADYVLKMGDGIPRSTR
jgi:three-Cys-motif partner protein